jgi:benzodiazapine receptor
MKFVHNLSLYNSCVKLRKPLALVMSLVLVGVISACGSAVTVSAIGTWYAALAKPFLNPPAWIFAPVWTLLYIAMAIAVWRIWILPKRDARWRLALLVYGLQLAANLLWSVLFFGLHNVGAALIDLAALWGFILACAILFHRLDKTAGYLLVPYILWVTFAGYLNLALFLLN